MANGFRFNRRRKKKLKSEIDFIFPKYNNDRFAEVSNLNILNVLKARVKKLINDTEEAIGELKNAETKLLKHSSVTSHLRGEFEKKFIKSFDTNCIALSPFTNKDVKSLSTQEFLSLCEYAEKQAKKNKK